MPKTIRASEAVRRFSDLLNTVKFRGETFTIVRGGKSVAYIGPVEGMQRTRTLGELKHLLQGLPRLGGGGRALLGRLTSNDSPSTPAS